MAMANVIGKKAAIGKIYNVQDAQSVTFEGLAKLCVHARGTPLFTHALSSHTPSPPHTPLFTNPRCPLTLLFTPRTSRSHAPFTPFVPFTPFRCASAMGKNADEVKIKTYNKKNFDFGEKKAFPMREQHFFCGIDQAMKDLEWKPQYNMAQGLKDAYENDFVMKKAAGKLNLDFSCDDMILAAK